MDFCTLSVSGPTGNHPIRTISAMRPFPDSMFTNHLRDLSTVRRKSSPLSISASHTHHANGNYDSGLGSTVGALEFQGYKPNAPQIQGEFNAQSLSSYPTGVMLRKEHGLLRRSVGISLMYKCEAT
jgi:hypothetical protein